MAPWPPEGLKPAFSKVPSDLLNARSISCSPGSCSLWSFSDAWPWGPLSSWHPALLGSHLPPAFPSKLWRLFPSLHPDPQLLPPPLSSRISWASSQGLLFLYPLTSPASATLTWLQYPRYTCMPGPQGSTYYVPEHWVNTKNRNQNCSLRCGHP